MRERERDFIVRYFSDAYLDINKEEIKWEPCKAHTEVSLLFNSIICWNDMPA